MKIGIVKKIQNLIRWRNEGTEDTWIPIYSEDYNSYNLEQDSTEVTYYICLKVLSESVAKLPVRLYNEDGYKVENHRTTDLLKTRPNPYMSATDFKTLMEHNRNQYGNAYAYISYNKKGKLQGIYPLNPQQVKVIVDDRDLLGKKYLYEYTSIVERQKRYYLPEEIIHLKGGLSSNGLTGKSVAEELASTISGAEEAQKYLNNLYKRGLTANATLQYTGELSKDGKEKLLREIKHFMTDSEVGNVLPIPLGMDLKPLDMKLTDAQFLELRKFNSSQIAAAFGLKPNHLNNYDKSSYANSEMQNLTFYVDTLLYILTKWEEELNYKLLTETERNEGFEYKFNVSAILRGDLKSQADALNTYVTGGIYTPNEARKYLGIPEIEGGDELIVNGSYVSLKDLGIAYKDRQGGDIDDKKSDE